MAAVVISVPFLVNLEIFLKYSMGSEPTAKNASQATIASVSAFFISITQNYNDLLCFSLDTSPDPFVKSSDLPTSLVRLGM